MLGGSVPVLCWKWLFFDFFVSGRGPKPSGGGKIGRYEPGNLAQFRQHIVNIENRLEGQNAGMAIGEKPRKQFDQHAQ